MFCGKCGVKLGEGDAFCKSCGAKVLSESVEQVSPAKRGRKIGSNTAIVALFVVGIVGAVLAVLLLTGSGGSSGPSLRVCGNNSCNAPAVQNYSRCSAHLYTCKVCRKEIGSLSYGYCNEHHPVNN